MGQLLDMWGSFHTVELTVEQLSEVSDHPTLSGIPYVVSEGVSQWTCR